MPKRARSETIVDFVEPAPKMQRIGTMPDISKSAIDILTEAVDSMETTPLHRTNAIYQPDLHQNNSQEADTSDTQESADLSVLPAITLVLSRSSYAESRTSYEDTPSTIVGPVTPNEGAPFESQLTGDSIE
jgi:hypothetical protein